MTTSGADAPSDPDDQTPGAAATTPADTEGALLGQLEGALGSVLPPDQAQQVMGIVAGRMEIMHGSSDMPVIPTYMLRELNQEVENGAERAFTMAELQAAHRRDIERITIQAAAAREREGQRYGFAVAVLGLLVAIGCAALHEPWVGGAVGLADLVGLVSVFVYGSRRQTQRAAAPNPAMPTIGQPGNGSPAG